MFVKKSTSTIMQLASSHSLTFSSFLDLFHLFQRTESYCKDHHISQSTPQLSFQKNCITVSSDKAELHQEKFLELTHQLKK